MKQVVLVNPFDCRMWSLHDRLDFYITEETCRAEIESFSKHGQLVPALGRPLIGDPDYKVELIYGARRLFVARHINKPLRVELREMSDKDAVIAMDIENRHRTDISPYERGWSYARWLRNGCFNSQEEIARALSVSPSQVSRLLKLAQLPAVVVDAFRNPADICEGWGLDLMVALSDSSKRQPTLEAARKLGRQVPRQTAREVYKGLLAAAVRGRKIAPRNHDRVIKDVNGRALFRIRQQRRSIALVLPVETVSASALQKIQEAIVTVLNDYEAGEAKEARPSQQSSAPNRVPACSV